MIFRASCVSPATSTFPPPRSLPAPLSTVTLFFFMRNSTPLPFFMTMRFLRFTMAARSALRAETSTPPMPYSARSDIWSYRWAVSSQVLAGMQPRRRQVPPRPAGSFSTMAVARPSWAPRMAAM